MNKITKFALGALLVGAGVTAIAATGAPDFGTPTVQFITGTTYYSGYPSDEDKGYGPQAPALWLYWANPSITGTDGHFAGRTPVKFSDPNSPTGKLGTVTYTDFKGNVGDAIPAPIDLKENWSIINMNLPTGSAIAYWEDTNGNPQPGVYTFSIPGGLFTYTPQGETKPLYNTPVTYTYTLYETTGSVTVDPGYNVDYTKDKYPVNSKGMYSLNQIADVTLSSTGKTFEIFDLGAKATVYVWNGTDYDEKNAYINKSVTLKELFGVDPEFMGNTYSATTLTANLSSYVNKAVLSGKIPSTSTNIFIQVFIPDYIIGVVTPTTATSPAKTQLLYGKEAIPAYKGMGYLMSYRVSNSTSTPMVLSPTEKSPKSGIQAQVTSLNQVQITWDFATLDYIYAESGSTIIDSDAEWNPGMPSAPSGATLSWNGATPVKLLNQAFYLDDYSYINTDNKPITIENSVLNIDLNNLVQTPGKYTLTIPADFLTVNGVKNSAYSVTFEKFGSAGKPNVETNSYKVYGITWGPNNGAYQIQPTNTEYLTKNIIPGVKPSYVNAPYLVSQKGELMNLPDITGLVSSTGYSLVLNFNVNVKNSNLTQGSYTVVLPANAYLVTNPQTGQQSLNDAINIIKIYVDNNGNITVDSTLPDMAGAPTITNLDGSVVIGKEKPAGTTANPNKTVPWNYYEVQQLLLSWSGADLTQGEAWGQQPVTLTEAKNWTPNEDYVSPTPVGPQPEIKNGKVVNYVTGGENITPTFYNDGTGLLFNLPPLVDNTTYSLNIPANYVNIESLAGKFVNMTNNGAIQGLYPNGYYSIPFVVKNSALPSKIDDILVPSLPNGAVGTYDDFKDLYFEWMYNEGYPLSLAKITLPATKTLTLNYKKNNTAVESAELIPTVNKNTQLTISNFDKYLGNFTGNFELVINAGVVYGTGGSMAPHYNEDLELVPASTPNQEGKYTFAVYPAYESGANFSVNTSGDDTNTVISAYWNGINRIAAITNAINGKPYLAYADGENAGQPVKVNGAKFNLNCVVSGNNAVVFSFYNLTDKQLPRGNYRIVIPASSFNLYQGQDVFLNPGGEMDSYNFGWTGTEIVDYPLTNEPSGPEYKNVKHAYYLPNGEWMAAFVAGSNDKVYVDYGYYELPYVTLEFNDGAPIALTQEAYLDLVYEPGNKNKVVKSLTLENGGLEYVYDEKDNSIATAIKINLEGLFSVEGAGMYSLTFPTAFVEVYIDGVPYLNEGQQPRNLQYPEGYTPMWFKVGGMPELTLVNPFDQTVGAVNDFSFATIVWYDSVNDAYLPISKLGDYTEGNTVHLIFTPWGVETSYTANLTNEGDLSLAFGVPEGVEQHPQTGAADEEPSATVENELVAQLSEVVNKLGAGTYVITIDANVIFNELGQGNAAQTLGTFYVRNAYDVKATVEVTENNVFAITWDGIDYLEFANNKTGENEYVSAYITNEAGERTDIAATPNEFNAVIVNVNGMKLADGQYTLTIPQSMFILMNMVTGASYVNSEVEYTFAIQNGMVVEPAEPETTFGSGDLEVWFLQEYTTGLPGSINTVYFSWDQPITLNNSENAGTVRVYNTNTNELVEVELNLTYVDLEATDHEPLPIQEGEGDEHANNTLVATFNAMEAGTYTISLGEGVVFNSKYLPNAGAEDVIGFEILEGYDVEPTLVYNEAEGNFILSWEGVDNVRLGEASLILLDSFGEKVEDGIVYAQPSERGFGNSVTIIVNPYLEPGDYQILVPDAAFVLITENGTYLNTEFYGDMFEKTEGGISTGIAGIAADGDGIYRVYNLNGMMMLQTKDASDLKNLNNGLYIINGKKVNLRK